jgi:hypothetical protein
VTAKETYGKAGRGNAAGQSAIYFFRGNNGQRYFRFVIAIDANDCGPGNYDHSLVVVAVVVGGGASLSLSLSLSNVFLNTNRLSLFAPRLITLETIRLTYCKTMFHLTSPLLHDIK